MEAYSYSAKGLIIFSLTLDGIKKQIWTKESFLTDELPLDVQNDYWDNIFTFNIYNLMSGEKFLSDVDEEYLIDYDGTISNIFVDGYKSNLGLNHKGMCKGKFLVDYEVFKDLCKKHKVEVNWANR